MAFKLIIMGKQLKNLLFILFALFISCKDKDIAIKLLQDDIKSLKIEVNNLKKEHQSFRFNNPKLIVTELGNQKIFDSNNLKICLYSKRPQRSSKTFLVVPAAFTDPKNKIDGLFIVKGNTVSQIINKKLNGICIVSNNKFQIIKTNQLIIDQIIDKKKSLFQQVLLVFDSKIVVNTLFKNKLNLRRAIVEINSRFYLVQSKSRISILDFQNSLCSINVKNAIYLDMGTYSEGWYKSDNKIIVIGETMTQIIRQSNWLVFQK